MIPKLLVVVGFVVFFLFSIWADGLDKKRRQTLLLLSCVVMALFAGTRNPWLWSDTMNYIGDFLNASGLLGYSFDDKPLAYTEMGFYLIGVVVRTFTSDATVYLSIVSILTFFFLYKGLQRYSMLPLLGLCIYVSRFMIGRNMMQIRAGLAIAIIISFTYLLKQKKWWQYVLVLLLSYNLHHSALVAAPLLILGYMNWDFSRKQIYIGVILSMIIAQFFGEYVKSYVDSSEFMDEMASSYIQEGSEKAYSNDLTNPVIWFQVLVLMIFTYYEDYLKKVTSYYYILRNAYFICTCILIVMCQYAIVAARTSTLFATYECMIIPTFLTLVKKDQRVLPYLAIGIGLTLLFYMNWPSAVSHIWVN